MMSRIRIIILLIIFINLAILTLVHLFGLFVLCFVLLAIGRFAPLRQITLQLLRGFSISKNELSPPDRCLFGRG